MLDYATRRAIGRWDGAGTRTRDRIRSVAVTGAKAGAICPESGHRTLAIANRGTWRKERRAAIKLEAVGERRLNTAWNLLGSEFFPLIRCDIFWLFFVNEIYFSLNFAALLLLLWLASPPSGGGGKNTKKHKQWRARRRRRRRRLQRYDLGFGCERDAGQQIHFFINFFYWLFCTMLLRKRAEAGGGSQIELCLAGELHFWAALTSRSCRCTYIPDIHDTYMYNTIYIFWQQTVTWEFFGNLIQRPFLEFESKSMSKRVGG